MTNGYRQEAADKIVTVKYFSQVSTVHTHAGWTFWSVTFFITVYLSLRGFLYYTYSSCQYMYHMIHLHLRYTRYEYV